MSAPAISAILVTPDTWSNMRNTLRALRTQTVRGRMELVLVGPSMESLCAPSSELEGFACIRRVVVQKMVSLGQVMAEGVRVASAALVVLTEDHCFPEREWAEAFIRRHESGYWAGVGPSVSNANPCSNASCAQFIMEYGVYSDVGSKGPSRQIPGHNSCYRRDVLLEYEPNLAWWLECETLMQWDMADRGLHLFLDKSARTHHWNCSRLVPTLMFAWRFSRVFAAYRCTQMSTLERTKLALLWPLIPIVRLYRLWELMVRLVGVRRIPTVLPPVFANLLVSGAAEGMGYLFGDGNQLEDCLDSEFHRERYLRRGEYLAFDETSTSDDGPPVANSEGVPNALL